MNAVHFPHLDSITQMASFAWSDEERRVTLESFFYIRLQVCLSKKERFLFGVSVFGIFNRIISKAFKSQARSFSKPSLFCKRPCS
jgi:hypothetical protein